MRLVPPLVLPPSSVMDRGLPMSLPFSPSDLLWRYPLGFPSPHTPVSPLPDKMHLPHHLASDPRVWSRDDVATFMRWCEREFDIPQVDMDMFQMNGKAVCLLTKGDLGERCPGAGDVLHNVLQLLVRDAQSLQRCLPASPGTPTSRSAYLALHAANAASAANASAGSGSGGSAYHGGGFADFHAPSLAHLMHHGNSVTLSPAPSTDSQSAGSPQNGELHSASYTGGSAGSAQSDSDSDSGGESRSPLTPSVPQSPAASRPQQAAREFFPADPPEGSTNGRLLWDFLQQLLNDPAQRYTGYIAWKNHDTGVFKIVDPAGLAKLWGIQKNHLSMNYDKMSRALRYYYRVNILRKVQGERHCYQFLRNPSELKSIKNMSLLRQQMSPTRPSPTLQQQQQLFLHHHLSLANSVQVKVERDEDDAGPTDLTMDGPTDLSPSRDDDK